MTLREKLFKERNTPFFMGNKFFSFTTGEELVISKELKGHYEGYCWIGQDLFETWIDKKHESRAWKVIELAPVCTFKKKD